MPARCSAFTMSRNSFTGPSGSRRELYGLMRRKERDRRITPVIDQPGRSILRIELEHRQQFDGGDAELLKIRNLLDQAGVSAARFFRKPGAGMAGEASHVHFINDGSRGRPMQWRVAFPIVGVGIHHNALHRGRRHCRLQRARPRGCSSSEQPRHGRTDPAEPCRDQIAFRRQDRKAPGRDTRKAVRASRQARRHASSDRSDSPAGRRESRAMAGRHLHDRRKPAPRRKRYANKR